VRVAVVGAGLAGLAAADALARGGVEVVVLEARDRVGGRVWSRELANGAVVEMGAEFILPGEEVILGLVERFRLGLWDKIMRYGDREPRGVDVDRDGVMAAAATVQRALEERGEEAAQMSVAGFLRGLDIDPAAREAMLSRCELSAANSSELVSAEALAHLAAVADDECPSVAGGNQRIALALARELGAALHLGSPVRRITWGGEGVTVAAAGSEVDADACVVAAPASVLPHIEFEPALPEQVAAAINGVVYGHAAKLFVPLREVPPPSAVLFVPGRYWTWTAGGPGDLVQPVVSAFVGSAPALESLEVAQGPAVWLDSVAELRPDLELEPGGALLSTWDDDPWLAAAYSTRTPTGSTGDLLTEPVGPLVFCGEHTASEWAGLMEGALRSGLRAAEQVLAARA
jgi:monoamine oxidase